jgi:hypothetical protein
MLLVLVSLIVGVVATGAGATPPADDFYLEKACGSDTVWDLPACEITEAASAAEMFEGGWIVYEDRVFWEKGDKVREIARVYLIAPSGDTLRGQIRWLDDHGMFTFSKGEGEAAGIHATGMIYFLDVLADGRYLFALEGTSHIE